MSTIQAINVPTVAADQGYARLLADLGSAGSRRELTAAFETAQKGLQPPTAASPTAPAPVTVPAPALPPPSRTQSPPVDTRPITRANAVGRRVLVPRFLWPADTCDEHAGKGWEAVITSATSVTVVVRFSYAQSASGRRYEDVRLPITQVDPL